MIYAQRKSEAQKNTMKHENQSKGNEREDETIQ